MVDFLAELSKTFSDRYLNSHGVYLKSIADVIAETYHAPGGIPTEETARRMIETLLGQGAKLDQMKQDSKKETAEFRNLRNCWYHECALDYPRWDIDERVKFASWKIIQCYYTVFSSIASLICCHHEEQKSHNKILNLYSTDYVRNRSGKVFILPPMNLHLNQQGMVPEETTKIIS